MRPWSRSRLAEPVGHAELVGGADPVGHAELVGEEGFTLIEVVVSLLLLAIVMTSALSLFVRSVASSSITAQRQQAVAIGNDLLEQIRAKPVATLVTGRTQSAVDAIWASPGVVSTSQTSETWDSSATSSSTPTVATSQTETVDGVAYTIKVFIDTCYESSSGSACSATTSSGASVMYRVSVGVTWTPGANRTCATSAGTCGYVVTTLVDRSSDATFNTN